MNTITTKDFYKALFNEDEHTCFGANTYATDSYPIEEGYHERAQFFTINPLIKGRTRSYKNIKRYRNFLFESDELAEKDQFITIANSKLPFTTVVYSGNASYHFIVSLADELQEKEQYEAVWKAIAATLEKYNFKADTKCKDPARFSRAANAFRNDHKAQGKQQKLYRVKGRVPFSELLQWFKDNDVEWTDYLPNKEYDVNQQGTSSVEDKLKIDWVKTHYMKGEEYVEHNRHNYQLKMAYNLLKTGMSAADINSYFIREFGEISTGIRNRDVASLIPAIGSDTIYVPTMEERRDYYKKIDEEKRQAELKSKYKEDVNDNAVDVVLNEGIERYIRVGTKYYKTDPITNGLIDWDKGTFQDDYGKGTVPHRLYDGFKYKPDYISAEFPADLFNGKFRNRFQRPTYQMTEGNWKTIETALRHAFKDQYELVLQMMAVMLRWPETRLPVMVLVGDEGAGKSAIIKIFQELLGPDNSKSIKPKQFEGDFDGYLMDTQLLVIEEAGAWKDPIAVEDQVKRLATEVGEIQVNPKYGKQGSYPWYGWQMFTSNDLSPIEMSGEATRYWVVRLTKIDKPIENFYDKIKREMGHFAYHLINNVSVEHPKNRTARLYFDPEEYHTSAKDFAKDMSHSDLYYEILEVFQKFFDECEDDTLYFNLKSLKTNLQDPPGDKTIKKCLAKEFKIIDKSKALDRPSGLDRNAANHKVGDDWILPIKKGQWYQAERHKFADNISEQMNQIMGM